MLNPKSIFNNLINDEELSFEARMLNMIYLVGAGGALAAALTRIALKASTVLIFVLFFINVSIIGLLYVANRFRIYSLCRRITVIVLCDVLFPMAFFGLGGIKSAMSGYFILSIVLVFLLLTGRVRIFFLVTHLLLITLCYYLGSRPPLDRFVADVSGLNPYLDHLQTLMVVGTCIGIIVTFQNRINEQETAKADKAKNDLAYQDKLLRVVNEAAEMLLSSRSDNLETTMTGAMEIMAKSVGADRMYIWRNRTLDGKLHYVQEYEWLDAGMGDRTLKAATGYSYIGSVPEWEQKFRDNECVNGPRDLLSKHENDILSPFDVKSILIIPVFLQNTFWGFVSFDDCRVRRTFSDDDVSILRSGSLLLANAVSRDRLDKERNAALEQAIQASKAKGDFLSNMSHEMRTPMNAIIGMTSIGKLADNVEKKNYAFGKIGDASSHLLGVINDILDMSKIEANKLELSSISFNFEKMLHKVVNVINFRVDERRQSFYVSIDKKIPRTLIGDDQRLAQVITNLLSNAVKFTPEGGTIRLDAHYAGGGDGACTIRIAVSDTGIGISEEQQKRLFNSFQQAESSTARKFGGTGLGLAISKRIVDLMNGKIWIESELGKGSTFAFDFQIEQAAEDYRPLLDSGVNWSNVRMLAVDDEAEIRNYFKDMAGRFNVAFDTAESGEEALGYIEANGPYDIYFVDWKMPGMGGLELSSKIKQRHDSKSVVTMMSAYEIAAIEDDARAVGVDKFLSKPLFPSDIADLINECLGVNGAASAETEEGEAVNFSNRRVLLAEDVEINREIVLALLEPTGLTIECAENGGEALSMFSANPEGYDMIFMDVQMPGMDGYEATRRIRALDTPRAKTVPVVAMTANVFREDIEKALEAGMNDHLGKPLDFDDVIKKLRQYLPPDSRGKPQARVIKYGELKQDTPDDWQYELVWSPELETGHKEIDSQHRQIFRITNNLTAACLNGQGKEMLGEILDFLAEYVIRHFNDEEELQIACDYPFYAEHKKYHDDFKETVSALVERFKADGSSDELLNQVNSVITEWLVHHIKREDLKLARYIREAPGVS